MHNKKIIAKGLIVSIFLLNAPVNVMANVVENYKLTVIDKEKDNSLKENKLEEFFNNLFNKFKQPKEVITVNKNIKVGTVKEITLGSGQFVPNLDGNPDGYETIRVTTTSGKELEDQDYDNLRTSGIPKVDLSNSNSDMVSMGAFQGAEHLVEFKFPKGVTHIGYSAFANCINLAGPLELPDNLIQIETLAFSNCSNLTGSLEFPETLKWIDGSAFANCTGLTGELKFPESLRSIKEGAFQGCVGFTGDLIIPNSVTKLGFSAFEGCSGFDGRLVISKSLSDIESSTFKGCSGLTGSLDIQDTITDIGLSAFEGCKGLTGDLVIPSSVEIIRESAFEGCSGFTGNIIIPNSVSLIKEDAFLNVSGVDKIVVKVDSNDLSTNYKEEMINNLPNTTQTVIDLPYNFDTSDTWLESTNKIIGKPSIKNIVDGEEIDINSGEIGKKVSLCIPVPYSEEDVVIMKDDMPYELAEITEKNKYMFTEDGTYEVNITTTLGNISNITFTVESNDYTNIEEAVDRAEISKNPNDIEVARDLVNALPESSKKDEFQGRLDAISPNIEFETKTATANLDVYIKSENLLSLSLNTNSVTFEDFSGVEDDEKLNALTLTVNSSLPYDVKAYLPVEITGSKYGEALDKEIFNIRANGELEYQTFTDTETPITLLSDQEAGNNNNHGIDLKLASDLAFKNDVYKATVKFEVEQK